LAAPQRQASTVGVSTEQMRAPPGERAAGRRASAARNRITPPSVVLAPFPNSTGDVMIRRFIGIAALVAAVTLPVAAQAQGVPGGIERGSRDGERAAGPVGAVVGGVIGGVVGGVGGILGVDER